MTCVIVCSYKSNDCDLTNYFCVIAWCAGLACRYTMYVSVTSLVSLAVLFLTLWSAGSTSADRMRDKLSVDRLPLPALNKRSATDGEEESGMNTTCSEERIDELMSSLPDDCSYYLFFEVVGYDFEQESEILCNSCGSVLYSLLQCLGTNDKEMELYSTLCTANENGDTCYELLSGEGVEELEIVSKCNDMMCTDECRSSLENSFLQYGCCLYSLVALNTSMTAVHDMWSACGIEEPGMCSPAFSGGDPTQSTTDDGVTSEPPEMTDGTDATTSSDSTDTSSTTPQPSSATTGASSTTTEPSSATNEPSSATTEPSSATTPATTSSTSVTDFTIPFRTETDATATTAAPSQPSTVNVDSDSVEDATAELQGSAASVTSLGLAMANILISLMSYLCMT